MSVFKTPEVRISISCLGFLPGTQGEADALRDSSGNVEEESESTEKKQKLKTVLNIEENRRYRSRMKRRKRKNGKKQEDASKG